MKTLHSFIFSVFLSSSLLFTGLLSASAQRRRTQQPPRQPNTPQQVPPELQDILNSLPPSVRRQVAGNNRPKGKLTFTAVSSGSTFGVKNIGVPLSSVPPADAAMRGGTVFVVEAGYCGDKLVGKYMSVLFLDEENRANVLTTNQIAQTANLNLVGTMRRWEHDCNPRRPAYREVASGPGGMEVAFNTTAHIRPRFFQVTASPTGRIWGPGLEDRLRANAPVPGVPVAFSNAPEENQSSYNPAVLDALRRAGYPVPERIPDFQEGMERVRAAGFEVADINKPYFYGSLGGTETITLPRVTVPKLSIYFHVSSTDIDAEMLIYKPKSMTALNAPPPASGTSNTTPPLSAGNNTTPGTGGQNPSTAPGSSGGGRAPGSGDYVLIPDGLQNSVGAQAFVNLDNDDKDANFDYLPSDTEVPGENDLIKVVLKVKPKSFAAVATLEIEDGGGYVKTWQTENKGREFTAFGERMPITREFPIREGDGYRRKELWIEGIEPHNAQKLTKFKFSYWENPNSREPDKVETFAVTIIGIKGIEWEGKSNSRNNDNNLDKDPNHRNPNDAVPDLCRGISKESTLKPEAVRVFPGRRMVGGVLDSDRRDVVRAKVELTVQPVEPVKIYFDSFDVDDPSSSGFGQTDEVLDPNTQLMVPVNPYEESWVDKEPGNTEDNRGEVLSFGRPSKSGRFLNESQEGFLEEEFSQQVQHIDFIVSMQPGDNFRVVGSGDKEFLRNLKNDDHSLHVGAFPEWNSHKQRIVDDAVFRANPRDPSKAEIRQAEKYASKVLTVWRFFHTEVDYMGPLKRHFIQGNVKEILPDTPRPGQTRINLHENLTAELLRDPPKITNVSTLSNNTGLKDSFQEGTITIRNVPYKVLHNSAEGGNTPDYVIVEGNVVGAPESRYFLKDDEEGWGFREGINLTDVHMPGRDPVNISDACYVADRYQPAYVVPDFRTLEATNRVKVTEFVRNLQSHNDIYRVEDLNRIYQFDHRATEASADFWTIYLLFGYKGATYEDGDPDGFNHNGSEIAGTTREGALEGITDADFVGIVVFLEAIFERHQRYVNFNGKTGEQDCIAHEIGHIFGAFHGDKGLMGEGTGQDQTYFSHRTLTRIRGAKHP